MSLQLAAQHLAHHGRGDDKMLVHMTPKEVSGLQQLAQAHGGSLTINPHTGLPEAGILDSLLPTIIGAGLSFIPGVGPLMAAGIVGSLQAARTGDLGKGLLAGLGAYGGAGLAGGFAEAGANAMTTAGVGDYTSSLAEKGIYPTLESGAPNPAFGEGAKNIALESQKQALGASMGDKFSAGFNAATASPSAALEFAKNNYGSGLMAVAPTVADQMVQTTTPAPTRKGQIHPFRYDDGQFTRLNAIDADKFQGFADGGMAQDNAGLGMFNYAQMQPAVDLHPNSGVGTQKMAEGGVAHFDGGGYTASDVANYLQANPGMSDTQIATAMDQYHVNPALVAQATGLNVGDVQSRYNAVEAPPAGGGSYTLPTGGTGQYATTTATGPGGNAAISNTDIQNWLQAHPGLSDVGIAQAMNQYGVSGAQMAAATGINPLDVMDRYGLAQDINKQGNIFGQYQGPGTPMTNLGSTYDQNWAAYMDAHKDPVTGQVDPITVKEIARTTGIPEAEIVARYAAAEKALHPVKPVVPIGGAITGLNSLNTTAPTPGSSNVTQTLLPTNSGTNAPAGTTNPYGNVNTPGDITKNVDKSITVQPNIPGRPYGAFTGIDEVTNAFTKGGGHTGPANLYVPKSVEELNAKYKNTGGTQQMLDYLSGKTTENPILHPITPSGTIGKSYRESVLGYPEQDISQRAYIKNDAGKMMRNPDFIPYNFDPKTGGKVYGKSLNQIRGDMNTLKNDADWLTYMDTNHIEPQQIADATGLSLGEVYQHIQAAKGNAKGSGVGSSSNDSGGGGGGDGGGSGGDGGGSGGDGGGGDAARGGIMYAAMGGQMYSSGGIGDLGGYSDGGRLLRGPGDGVSDSIPATIGQGKPARLADGEFVVPARIVSELGNGSTEAGARKLYAMMDRVQNTRGKTIGKGRVATNTRADKFLPA